MVASMVSRRAHPRSRGENEALAASDATDKGSSPLTRGKRSTTHRRATSSGLIPAHAGKTAVVEGDPLIDWAHPRSRGENYAGRLAVGCPPGSSPLTRGKPRAAWTSWTSLEAHPRSRGENESARIKGKKLGGSSPLTRGKPRTRFSRSARAGLIPAHAGKTGIANPTNWETAAHPRSRGENHTPKPCT